MSQGTGRAAGRVIGQFTKAVPGAVICAALLVGCGAAPNMSSKVGGTANESSPSAPRLESDLGVTASQEGAASVSDSATAGASSAVEAEAVTAPQLIRRATLSLEVEDAIASVKAIQTLIQQQQGDILSLQEETLPGDGSPRRASLELRVPQARLDATLDELGKLGKVENRAITAEDVSSQLVDTSARLRNLRKQEEMVLEIMERSGEIADVLEVSNQLATVRQSIEQLDAQLQHLKTQVAYSTINLQLAEPLAAAVSRRSLGTEMQSAWNGASASVGAFSRGLLVMGLWLLAYSPYLAVIAAVVYGVRRSRRRSKSPHSTGNPPSTPPTAPPANSPS